MKWTLKEHGERLEVEASEFVATCIPNYERVWSVFIGHKGNGKMADAFCISKEADTKRKLFAEHHYTILESIFLMYRLAKKEEALHAIISFDQYCELMDNLMAFYSYSGRIKDNFDDCFQIIGYPMKTAPDPTSVIKSFWEKRHVVLHGKKMPLFIDENGLYLIPSISSNENLHGWDKKKSWVEASKINKEYISDSMMNVIKEICPKLNSLFGKLLAYVEKFITENEIELEPPPSKENMKNLLISSLPNIPAPSGITSIDVYGFRAIEEKKRKAK